MINRDFIATTYKEIQTAICHSIAQADGGDKTFEIDTWSRPEGGGGVSRILQNGKILEKAGVNFSAVSGELTSDMQKSLKVNGSEFFATGVSIVMHPHNPFVPIIHMNIRYFEIDGGAYWFGGGIDLTPHYIQKADAHYFHSQLRDLCHTYDPLYYSKFKEQADQYFYIPHRAETRGIGGIFFDHIAAEDDKGKKGIFDFTCALGALFPKVYAELMLKNFEQPFTKEQKEWQLIRRGRYAEFNLVYDRGTKFGLYSNGRAESILMSLPPQANWVYNTEPKAHSQEGQTLAWLRSKPDWLSVQ